MTKHVSAQKIALIALFIVINIVGGHLALYARLPIYLDTIGTLLGSAFFGPIGGLFTGILTALVNGTTGDLFSIYFMPSQIATALISGFVYKKIKPTDFQNIWWVALIISIPATIISTIITVILFHGITSSGSSMIVQVLNGFGLSQSISVFLVQVGTDYLDRVIGVYVVAIVYRTLLSRIKLV
ncbi:ECF transporter S component [Leuconostoc gelidum]|uniref:ECF transporter S component n=1 Tax=Leuconostoc gelidum TaxID=1244 RepID=UPI000219213A|nr:ECF transporter S component [Leuconostoc gelidum]AFS39889.1 integral membrane protein [Leuconostoc gelidum JB7]MBZ5992055.1 ECF transporter S component [Leuconostoc gelidum subsp. gelidum]USP16953.1 ECF transporter S component [Leuconostoc gelidum subsp. aenigmaticum]GMA66756.1 purine nucleoside transporter [Leuconostoc gelidum subsp. gelidum]